MEIVGDSSVKFICHVTVSVERSNVLDYIRQNSKGQLDDSAQRIKKLEEDYARVSAELAEYKRRYQTATQTERAEINTAIKRNEKEFTALQYTEQGAAFYDKREYKKAVEALNKALEINPRLFQCVGVACRSL